MKNIKIYLFAAMAALAVGSCSDAIDIVQDSELTDTQIFQSVGDLQNYLNGSVYTSADVQNEVFITSLLTDELKIGTGNNGQQREDFRFIIASDNVYADAIWLNNYTLINRVNRLIRAAEGITPQPSEVAAYNNILAQARFMRAFAYLKLETYFSTDMKNDAALGVIISTTVPEISEQLPRSTNAAVWTAVEADIAFAEANIAATGSAANVNAEYFVGKATISALKARMYLYRGKYDLAKTNAQTAITQSGLSLTPALPIPAGTVGSAAWNTAFYASPSTNPYRNLWNDTSRGEKIFSLSRQVGGPGGNIAGSYVTNTTNATGSPFWSMGLNLFATINSNAGDIRRYAFIDPTSTTGNYIIDKYPGKGTQPLKNDHKIFRISEMNLIIAEADARNSSFGTAAAIVKTLRDARKYTPGATVLPVYTSVQGALADILKERRIEFAFEGHRYIDVKRAGADAGISISRNAGDDFLIASTPLTLPTTDYRFTLPIPSGELLGNPTIVQNPGY